jgi:hypothetical protein
MTCVVNIDTRHLHLHTYSLTQCCDSMLKAKLCSLTHATQATLFYHVITTAMPVFYRVAKKMQMGNIAIEIIMTVHVYPGLYFQGSAFHLD